MEPTEIHLNAAWFAKIDAGIYDLFQLAALLLGDERGAAQLVETVIGEIESDPCVDEAAAVQEARSHLIGRAIRKLREGLPGAFEAPAPVSLSRPAPAGFLEEAAAWSEIPAEQLRQGVESLSPLRRTVFVLRVLAGQDAADTVELLRRNSGGQAGEWTVSTVREIFRQALSSLRAALVVSTPPPVGV